LGKKKRTCGKAQKNEPKQNFERFHSEGGWSSKHNFALSHLQTYPMVEKFDFTTESKRIFVRG
jgi:hypothetical protein